VQAITVSPDADTGLPSALAALHRSLAPGATIRLRSRSGAERPARWRTDVLEGAGFGVTRTVRRGDAWTAAVTRGRTIPDTVGPGMRLLVCGLNPSGFSADAGVGFARPGNRFWPAALAAGLVSRDRDPEHALRAHGIGMTDLVKRATPASAAVTRAEYASGLDRVVRLVGWLRPGAVLFVGLEGWRAVVDRRAVPGPQPDRPGTGLAGTPVYLMPSTSGRNASSSVDALTDHLRAAAPPARR